MKMHITNLYNFIDNNNLIDRQKKIANTARFLGFHELGIPVYNTSKDTDNEMSKRQDGIIAAIEYGDVVVVQLPMENDTRFEDMLINKIEVYSGKKPILLWSDENYYSENVNKYSSYINKLCDEDIDSYTEIELQKYIFDLLPDEELRYVDESDFVHIGFGLYDRDGTYSVWVGTAMQSIIENTDVRIVFHILHDDTLTDDNKNKLMHVANSGGHKLEFHYIDSMKFDEVKHMMGYFTIDAMFRLLLPEILYNLDKIIYLDADLFVNRDIAELWNENIDGYCVAAVADEGTGKGSESPYPVLEGQIDRDKYFNSGVLYMNLNEIRRNGNLCQLVLEYLQTNIKATCPDQDALNVVYKDKCKYIDASWNLFVKYERNDDNVIKNKIYHYAGTSILLYNYNEIDIQYLEYIMKAPWGFDEGRKQINLSIGLLNRRLDNLKNIVKNVAQDEKKYIFYGPKTFAMQNMMNMMNCDTEICEIMESDILNNKEKYIVFVLPEAETGTGIDILLNAGWKNQEDFFVIPCVLDASKGGYVM